MDFRSKLPSLTRFQAITWIKVSLIAGLLEGAVTFAVGCMIMAFQGESHGQGLSSLALGSLSAFMSCLPLGLFSLICSGGRKNPFSEKKRIIIQASIGLAISLWIVQSVSIVSCAWINLYSPYPWILVVWNNIVVVILFSCSIFLMSKNPKCCQYSVIARGSFVKMTIYLIVCCIPLIWLIHAIGGSFYYTFYDFIVERQAKPCFYNHPTPYEKALLYAIATSISIWSMPMFFSFARKRLEMTRGSLLLQVLTMSSVFAILIITVNVIGPCMGMSPLAGSDWASVISWTSLVFWLWLAWKYFQGE